MNSPYMGKFRVTQEFKGASIHDGLDMVGIDSKEIHAVASGIVTHSGWENPNNHLQGFGLYVSIQSDNGDRFYYGHLSAVNVREGDTVKITDVIGIEGSTGYSTGSHCHCCIRPNGVKANAKNVAEVLGIPNTLGVYDDEYATKYCSKSVSISVGSKVGVNNGSLDFNGNYLASWVYRDTFDVIEINGERAVIGKGSSVTCAINVSNLFLK